MFHNTEISNPVQHFRAHSSFVSRYDKFLGFTAFCRTGTFGFCFGIILPRCFIFGTIFRWIIQKSSTFTGFYIRFSREFFRVYATQLSSLLCRDAVDRWLDATLVHKDASVNRLYQYWWYPYWLTKKSLYWTRFQYSVYVNISYSCNYSNLFFILIVAAPHEIAYSMHTHRCLLSVVCFLYIGHFFHVLLFLLIISNSMLDNTYLDIYPFAQMSPTDRLYDSIFLPNPHILVS